MIRRLTLAVAAIVLPSAAHAPSRRRGDGGPGRCPSSASCCRSPPARCCSRTSGTHHYGKIAARGRCSRCAARACVRRRGRARALVHALLAEYLTFIMLLFALYTIAGGILVTGNLRGTPADQYRHPRLRHGDRERRRHHRRVDDPDPAADARQRQARQQRRTSSSSSSSWSPTSAAR